MTSDTATLLTFPTVTSLTEVKQDRSQSPSRLLLQTDTPPSLQFRGVSQGPTKLIVAGPQPMTSEQHARHVASVVRIAIRSAKRRGVRLESMLSIPRKWLLDLCDEGDPTCLIMRDWLLGNQKHLPKDLEDAATGWTSGKWGDA
ncbi:hypothetical protein IMCC20628_03092 [Hoeflea sp. IMCC20628]|uniref:hypothetical protein n=1 Tax=Hoeflea sp. IMCC20628 TaxID=1620421 RepID=UPI00063B0415|nr:hypothetical protein [Hoeflea sp. IMCC20628]AKI01785.1 hypothetical protein IMCC20628_03092 [Hoeflea sp. IMCC20628]